MEGADFLKLEELILLAIAGRSEIYGLEIATEIAKASEDRVQLNYGSLYPYLNRLEKKGYITSRWEEENDRKGARRKYYQITEKGTQSLDEATFIRQRLRQQSDTETIANYSQLENNIETLIPILQHSGEKERIRAIYKLENVAKINPAHHWEIMQALAAFIRTNSPVDKKGSILPDIQAALDVIGNRKIYRDPLFGWIDLSKTNLIEAYLGGADLIGVYLRGADLRRADLRRAELAGADLIGANLIETNIGGANLIGADLGGADLRGSDIRGADLAGANLGGVNLEEANLEEANLEEANLEEAKNMKIEQLHSARNWKQAIDIPDYLKDIEDEIPF
jgi:DNA-binding PadR family transcriptional regulator